MSRSASSKDSGMTKENKVEFCWVSYAVVNDRACIAIAAPVAGWLRREYPMQALVNTLFYHQN